MKSRVKSRTISNSRAKGACQQLCAELSFRTGKEYDARALKLGWFGIVDETHEEYAYPPGLFEIIQDEGISHCDIWTTKYDDFGWNRVPCPKGATTISTRRLL